MIREMTREQYNKEFGQNPTTLVQPTQTPKENTSVGQKVLNTATDVSNFFGGKGVADTYGASFAKIGKSEQEKNIISADQPTVKQTIGSGLQLGANFIPGGAGTNLATKVGLGAATGLTMDIGSKLQNNQTPTPGIGTITGASLPIAGAGLNVAGRVVGRLLKGLGSGLSGAPTSAVDRIINNPQYAKEATRRLNQSGNSKVLEENARQLVNGISGLRKEARQSFGTGLEQLKQEDIKPEVFRQNTQTTLDKYGSTIQNNQRVLQNIEFNDPKNLSKASQLIDKLSSTELDGKSLRKLADDIDNSKYKIATSDERLSFNAFLDDLSGSLKNAVNSSTDKLTDINKKFSDDMQLVQSMESMFGKVKYKNLPEVIKASQKLEGLFSQKGIAPEKVDDFFRRIGINPDQFKTSEAVRQISNKEAGANSVGTSIGEVTRGITSAVVTPQMIRDLSIKTGLTSKKLLPLLRGMNKGARNVIINALLKTNGE